MHTHLTRLVVNNSEAQDCSDLCIEEMSLIFSIHEENTTKIVTYLLKKIWVEQVRLRQLSPTELFKLEFKSSMIEMMFL